MARFKTKHTEWLLSNMAITVSSLLSSNPKPLTSRPVGRPPIEYVNAGPRQKRKLASDLAVHQGHNTSLLVHAAAVSAEKSNEEDTALVLKNIYLTPSDHNKVRKNLFTQKTDSVRLTEDEAFFEFVLKIAYRLKLKKWQVRDENGKKEMAKQKNTIQKKMWNAMALHVDKPKQNGNGNTNDGNTARRAFAKPKLLAEILGLDENLIAYFNSILIAISCHLPIDPTQFKKYCQKTVTLYMSLYPWFPMSATVHKVLMHGYQIIEASILPLGVLGENASEARNKYYKSDRRLHARKSTRQKNMEDVFHRAMDSSDPLVSSIYLAKRLGQQNKLPLPADVIELLESPNFLYPCNMDNNNNAPVFDANNSDSDSDSENPFTIEIDVEDDF
ncbi:uncharacterized protein LOC122757785 [Drosophila mojavensis]|uniref:uncharacterized protein LOC122757785 n=1 Tax=Drosophila mojavensis TaxID=7230 RepID=UPI001CD0EBD8|nr:uncharacterized protein LOC122757785 [Drosophila mojavensis]